MTKATLGKINIIHQMILDNQKQLLMVFVLLWKETDTDSEQNLMREKTY